jgi:hypothetical protein
LLLVEGKAEGLDQVKLCAGSKAAPPRISGIPVNLRLHQHDVNVICGKRPKLIYLHDSI